ncbi:MAG: LLM class flavin-dependent oxidoreductase, partial [Hymenobacter sp.]
GTYCAGAPPKMAMVSGSPSCPARTTEAGVPPTPIQIGNLGGAPAQYVPFAQLYRESAQQAGHDAASLPLALNCHFHLAETSQQASDEYFPAYSALMGRIGRERGWPPLSRAQFEQLRGPQGPLFVGSVREVIDKLLYLDGLFGNTRFLAQLILEGIPHERVMRSIELFGTQVAPAVREALGVVVPHSLA